jgi:electron transport complex protein RnfB
MSKAKSKSPRNKIPKRLAVINADNCTGCESCIEVCPVDCIELLEKGLGVKGTDSWCEVDLDRCIGCALCVRIPRKRGELYELTVCPWDAIEMVPTEQVAEAVAGIGGPPDYARENTDRLVRTAQRLAESRVGS